jgi:hypothetical protein
MPNCDCGFDFVKARIKGRRLASYALIPHKNYRAAIRREHTIVIEKNAERKHTMIANASSSVESVTRCPDCGAWLLDEPMHRSRVGYVVLRKSVPAANKTVQRTGASRSARKRNRRPSAAGSRR